MQVGPPQPVGDYRAALGESPVWDAQAKRLLWIDGINYRLLTTDIASGTTSTTSLPDRPGSAFLLRDGTPGVAIGKSVARVAADGSLAGLAELDPTLPGRFNDSKPDARGRLWVGTANSSGVPDCALFSLGPDGRFQVRLPGVRMSNGLGWSPIGQEFYYVDTGAGCLDAFDFDDDSGAVSNRRTLLRLREGELPDGLTVDAAGRIWLAVWGGGKVLCLTPDGTLVHALALPTSRVSSCTFGGADLKTLFVTTAQEGATPAELAAEPLAGALFAVPLDIAGLPPNRFGA